MLPFGLGAPAWGEPVLGTDFTIGTNFTGPTMLSAPVPTGWPTRNPPDTMGSAGPNHVVVLINGGFAVYDKTGTQLESRSLNSFWNEAGVPTPPEPIRGAFDPRILYDPANGRWIAASVDAYSSYFADTNNFLLVISNTSDPRTTAGWTGFLLDADSDPVEPGGYGMEWADFPKLGMNADAVVVAADMFAYWNNAQTNTNVLVVPKASLLAGNTANATLIEDVPYADADFTAQPIVDLDNGSGKLPFLSANDSVLGNLERGNILNAASGAASVDPNVSIAVTPLPNPGGVNQAPPVTLPLYPTFGNRFTSSVILQNGSLWAAHSVAVNGRDAIEWFEIRESDNTVLQSGLITAADMPPGMQDPDLEFNFPSISVNDTGDVVIGFSGGSPNTNPLTGTPWWMSTFAIVGETVGGVTTFSDIVMTQPGLAPYEFVSGTFVDPRNRWGDYSATVLDPADPTGKTFWTFQEFAIDDNIWAIKVTQIIVPEPSSLLLALLGLSGLCLWRRRLCRCA